MPWAIGTHPGKPIGPATESVEALDAQIPGPVVAHRLRLLASNADLNVRDVPEALKGKEYKAPGRKVNSAGGDFAAGADGTHWPAN
jgi:hypothetical protein